MQSGFYRSCRAMNNDCGPPDALCGMLMNLHYSALAFGILHTIMSLWFWYVLGENDLVHDAPGHPWICTSTSADMCADRSGDDRSIERCWLLIGHTLLHCLLMAPLGISHLMRARLPRAGLRTVHALRIPLGCFSSAACFPSRNSQVFMLHGQGYYSLTLTRRHAITCHQAATCQHVWDIPCCVLVGTGESMEKIVPTEHRNAKNCTEYNANRPITVRWGLWLTGL